MIFRFDGLRNRIYSSSRLYYMQLVFVELFQKRYNGNNHLQKSPTFLSAFQKKYGKNYYSLEINLSVAPADRRSSTMNSPIVTWCGFLVVESCKQSLFYSFRNDLSRAAGIWKMFKQKPANLVNIKDFIIKKD